MLSSCMFTAARKRAYCIRYRRCVVAQLDSKQLIELFKHLTSTGAQALIDHTAEIEFKQLLRKSAALLASYLRRKGACPNPHAKAQILLALFWATRERKYLELARLEAREYENGVAGAWTFAIIWQTSKEEQDLVNARVNALSQMDEEDCVSGLSAVVSDTGDTFSCSVLQKLADRLSAQLEQNKQNKGALTSQEKHLLYTLQGVRDILTLASIRGMEGTNEEFVRKEAEQFVLHRLEPFDLWFEVARITRAKQDVCRARSCITYHRGDCLVQYAKLAASFGDPQDLAEARRLYEGRNYGHVEGLLAIATASRDLADIKRAFHLLAVPITGILAATKELEQILALVRLMAEELEKLAKITVKIPA